MPAGYDFVSVHDAVRPLIEVETIEQVIGTVRNLYSTSVLIMREFLHLRLVFLQVRFLTYALHFAFLSSKYFLDKT